VEKIQGHINSRNDVDTKGRKIYLVNQNTLENALFQPGITRKARKMSIHISEAGRATLIKPQYHAFGEPLVTNNTTQLLLDTLLSAFLPN